MFFITRFPHGSAGKFLSSIIQTSEKVDHWSEIIQSNKSNNEIIDELNIQYFKRSFPKDHTTHLRMEPMVTYNTDLYSVSYLRGNDVTLDEYIKHAIDKKDNKFIKCLESKIYPNIIFSRPTNLPLFCESSKALTILVTTSKELEWLFKTLVSKHFVETGDTIHYIPSDPDYCSFQSLPTVLKFKNQHIFSISEKEEIYKKYITEKYATSWDIDIEKFRECDEKLNIDNIFINLDEILIKEKFLQAIKRIFYYFELGEPNLNLIESLHTIWISRQFSYEQ